MIARRRKTLAVCSTAIERYTMEKWTDNIKGEPYTSRGVRTVRRRALGNTTIVIWKGTGYLAYLIYNRVNNEGKTISDRFQKDRNHKVCKEITLEYGYNLGKGKQQVHRQQLRGADKVRYELYDAVKITSTTDASWNELVAKLDRQGIQTIFKYKSGTSEIQGVSFAKGDLQFKGSKIDRTLSYGKLDALIRQNKKLAMVQPFRMHHNICPTVHKKDLAPLLSPSRSRPTKKKKRKNT